MTEIMVNKQNITTEINHGSSIDQLIDLILNNYATPGDVISNMLVNGSFFDYEDKNNNLKQTVQQVESISFELKNSLDLAFEALDSCNSYIDNVTDKIQTLLQFYSENKLAQANSSFSEIIEIIDLFIQLITKIHRTIRIHNPKQFTKGPVIQNLEIHLLSILKALIPAKEKEDIIMLCDLLEYELVDNLKQWKIQAIPELKKYKKTNA